MSEVEVRSRRVEALLDTKPALACSQDGRELIADNDLGNGPREELFELFRVRPSKHGP
jgi:hypothetical protein